VNEARRRQLELYRRMTPEQRLARASQLIALGRAARDARLRRQHPDATDEELRWIRVRDVLGLPHDAPLP
jgi:hypothetical protein